MNTFAYELTISSPAVLTNSGLSYVHAGVSGMGPPFHLLAAPLERIINEISRVC